MNKFIVILSVISVVASRPEAPAHVGLSGYSNGGSSGGGSGINEYVDEALLARVGDLIARGGDGTGTQQGTEGLQIDSEIIARVSGSLGDNGASGPSTAYGPPSRNQPGSLGQPEPAQRIAEFELTDSNQGGNQGGYDAPPAAAPAPEYGAPSRSPAPIGNFGGSSSSGAITLGRPEMAQRVADFSVSGGSQSSRGSNNGGYN